MRRITIDLVIDEEGRPSGMMAAVYDEHGQGAILDAQELDGWDFWAHLGTRLKALSRSGQLRDIPR